ncbi:MAG: hypothetical protein IPI28_12855 [Candidatus Omnitrophica bacterium]|nr:hypothetical protein [Candidatus Omnitrophota bacterium]
MIASLRIPWSGFPEGPLDFRCPLLRYTPGNLDVSLADIRIRSVTIATSDLPWLRILTQTERWRLNEAVLGTHLKLEIESGDCEWDQGEISIDGERRHDPDPGEIPEWASIHLGGHHRCSEISHPATADRCTFL